MLYGDVALFQSVRLADRHRDADSFLAACSYIKCCLWSRKAFWQRDASDLQGSRTFVLDGNGLSYCNVVSAKGNLLVAH